MFEFELMGQVYRQTTDLEAQIGVGDLIYFPEPLDRDAFCYLFIKQYGGLCMVNWLGRKSGLLHATGTVHREEYERYKGRITLGWFKENWDTKFLGQSSFDKAIFLKFHHRRSD